MRFMRKLFFLRDGSEEKNGGKRGEKCQSFWRKVFAFDMKINILQRAVQSIASNYGEVEIKSTGRCFGWES